MDATGGDLTCQDIDAAVVERDLLEETQQGWRSSWWLCNREVRTFVQNCVAVAVNGSPAKGVVAA